MLRKAQKHVIELPELEDDSEPEQLVGNCWKMEIRLLLARHRDRDWDLTLGTIGLQIAVTVTCKIVISFIT